MAVYNHLKIERKWQKEWEKKKIYQAKDKSKNPKYYSLIEFPYPSGDGLHVGHPRPYIGMDIISRKRRLEGYNVLYPIGWDAFGLPTENYAIKTGKDPRVVTKKNTDTYRRQIKSLGISFDWSREINTTDPKYYKWTQWIFLQFLKKGLAYKAKMTINWCPSCKIGLANEEVVGGVCERCGTSVEKREKEQWMLAITKYAERLDKDLDTVDYLPQIKLAQRNWIGKSEGAEIDFEVAGVQHPQQVKVFTTRPDTIFGATFLALAPEVAKKITGKDYGIKADTDRENKEKIGVDTGLKAKNPANGEMIPVFAVNYVSAEYGTGAIMGVPAHDERDFEFAKKYNLAIKRVVEPKFISEGDAGVKKDQPFIKRNAVCAIIYNPKNKKYLCSSWKLFKMHGLITGGIEDGEDIVQSATREIYEETGYKNIKLVKDPKFALHTFFYHRVKKENRWARFQYLFFELVNEEHDPISEEEDANHEVVWKSKEELKDFFSVAEGEFTLNFLNNPDYIHTGDGILHNSGLFDGLDSEKAKKEIIKFIGGKEKTTFKLRDWIFSRQRYWGEPIPVIHCKDCGMVPVLEKDLPVELPKLTGKMKNYKPTDSGESPLANIAKWVNVKCPKCKGKAKRETDTMPNWAGSSWYYLRYTDPKNSKEFASMKNLKYWTPVDWYNGGNEHTTLHLLYSRFWHKFLFDLGLVPTSEPYKKRTSHGMILGEGGVKMSKSLGNVINPDEIVKIYGADTLRVYEMFMGPFNQSVAWSTESIIGARRFIEKVWRIGQRVLANKISYGLTIPELSGGTYTGAKFHLPKLLHKTIKKVSEDIEEMHFNTAISSMMILATEMESAFTQGFGVTRDDYKKFIQILAPFVPYVTEELWNMLGEKKSINFSSWPKWSADLMKDFELKIVIQINGKLKTEIMIQADDSEEVIKQKALVNETISKHIADKSVKKIIYVKNRIINIVL